MRAGGTNVDWSAALTNLLSQYCTALQYDGSLHTVRTPDLVHLTADGAIRTSVWTVKALADLWAANPGVTSARAAPGKRVIGVAGDHVVCCDASGRVTVNGVAAPLQPTGRIGQTRGVNPVERRRARGRSVARAHARHARPVPHASSHR